MADTDRRIEQARLLLQQRRPKECATAAREAIASDPEDPRGHAFLTLALVNLEDKGCLKPAQKNVALAPEDPFAQMRLGLAWETNGKKKQAREAYLRALALDGADGSLHKAYGDFLVRQDKAKEALPHLERAVGAAPEDVGALISLGIAQHDLDRADERDATLDTLLRLAPTHPKVHFLLGHKHLRQGRTDEARASFRASLRGDPTFFPAKQGYVVTGSRNHPFFGLMARWMLFVSRMPPRARVVVGFAPFIVLQVGRGALRNSELRSSPWVVPLVLLWLLFVLYLLLAPRFLDHGIKKGWLDG